MHPVYRLIHGPYALRLPGGGTLTLYTGEHLAAALYEHVPEAHRRRFAPVGAPAAAPALEPKPFVVPVMEPTPAPEAEPEPRPAKRRAKKRP